MLKQAKKSVTVSTRVVLKVLFLTALFIGLIFFLFQIRTVLVWILTAFSFALALNPAVVWVAKIIPKHHRVVATLVVFLAAVVGFVALTVTMLPPVVTQTEQLVQNLPTYTQQLSRPGTAVGDLVNQYDIISKVQSSQSEFISRLTNASGTFVGIVARVFSSFVALISIIGLTFFMLMEGPGWLRMFWKVLPKDRQGHAKRLAGEMYTAVVGYVNGKILAAFLAGLSAAIMLLILGVPYAAALALVVGLLSIIPMFGATIGAVIVVSICLFTSVPAAIVMAIFFFVYQQVENNIIQPIIFNRTVDVSPLLVFISVLVGTASGGILGALIAIPVTASIQILVRDYYSRHAELAEGKRA